MFRIPEIEDQELLNRAAKISPLIRRQNKLFYIKQPDLRNTAFNWDPETTTQAEQLQEVCRIVTYHSFAYHGFFKPSIAEVLAQIPSDLIDTVSAFETLGPTSVADLNLHKKELNEGYHVAETILYR